MSIIGSNVLAGASGSGVEAYEIEQSLRFDGGSYLNRTPGSAGNRRTSTLSFWFKWESQGGEGVFLWANGRTKLAIDPGGNDRLSLDDYDGSFNLKKEATRSLRDPSAWYHVVVAMDTTNATADDRHRIYLNGQRITTFSTSTNSSQNFDTDWNNNVEHRIGYDGNFYFRGYIAEMHMLDGTAVTDAEDFGEYDDNGVWRPIEYTGDSYGTNGFYLKFDETATNGIGHDHSGNGNNFTASGFLTSGIGTDVFSDTPTKNWCTMNPLNNGTGDTENGSLEHSRGTGDANSATFGTFGVTSGKWYWEAELYSTSGGQYPIGIGFGNDDLVVGESTKCLVYSSKDGDKVGGGSYTSYGDSYGIKDIIGVALDLETQDIEFYKNGVSQGVAFTSISTDKPWFPISWKNDSNVAQSFRWNFGQREFAYPPGTASATDYFNAIIWTGDGSNPRTLTGVGFQSDLVWIKARSAGGDLSHQLFDSVRGLSGGNSLQPDRAVAEGNEGTGNGYLSAFTSDGFTVDTTSSDIYVNDSGKTYVAWCWKAGGTASSNTDGDIDSNVSASTDAGFSVFTYTGNGGTDQTVGHGLGAAPSACIVKSRAANSWFIRHDSLPSNENLNFNNSTTVTPGGGGLIGDLSSTSTITLKSGSNNADNINANGTNYVAYCWIEKDGVSKFGSFTGNGSSTGPFVECGFKPRMVIVKRTDAGSNWFMYDTVRGTNNKLYADDPSDENGEDGGSTTSNTILSLSTGFQMTSGNGSNTNGGTYIFMAWAETFSADEDYKALNTANLPAPEIKDGSKYFDTKLFTAGTTTVTGLSFQPDWVWVKNRDQTYNHRLIDAVRGIKNDLYSNANTAEQTNQSDSLLTFTSDGFTHGKFGSADADDFVAWNWLAGNGTSSNTNGDITSTVSVNATAGFSIVSYTAENAVRTVGHGLGVAPVMYMTKNRDSSNDWAMYWEVLGATRLIHFNLSSKNETDSAYWNDTAPTSTVFTVGTNTRTGGSTDDYIAYCFAEVEGYSRFSEYSANGNSDGPYVHCGFRPSVLIIKNYAGGSETNWVIKDTTRDTYNPSTKRLNPNITAVESDDSNVDIDFLANGFKIRSTNTSVNESGSDYLFMAFAENPFGGDGVSPATAR